MRIQSGKAGVAIVSLALLLLIVVPRVGDADWPSLLTSGERPTLAPLLEKATPAVVNISVTGTVQVRTNPMFQDPFFRRFFNVPDQPRSVPRQSAGSGVIVDARNGYVLTNHHVVNGADRIDVTLQDRRRFEAELIGSDEGTDIALLKIDASGLTALPLGNSEDVRVGDFVLAIGNPFGLGQTVTSGIVSALGRSGISAEGYEDFIQTDASINPGNSGGALIDIDGDLIGINTAIIAPSGGNVGIGFAVPVAMAEAVMHQILEYGEVRRGRLGVTVQDVTPELAQALDLDTAEGAVITEVQADSAADKGGLLAGDVVVAIDGAAISNAAELRNRIGLTPVGEDLEINVMRDGRRKSLNVEIGVTGQLAIAAGSTYPQLRGADIRNLDPGHPRYDDARGPYVERVEQGSPAWRNGIREGDIILAVNRTRVRNVDELAAILDNAGGAIALSILRGNTRLFIVVQ